MPQYLSRDEAEHALDEKAPTWSELEARAEAKSWTAARRLAAPFRARGRHTDAAAAPLILWRDMYAWCPFCLATQGASPIGRCAVLACSPLLALALVAGWLASLRCAGWQLTDAQTRYLDSLSLYARVMHRPPPKLPVLFLYSTSDALIPFGAVEGMMARLAASGGCEVLSKRWERSPHAQHLRTDPDGYRAELQKVLSRL